MNAIQIYSHTSGIDKSIASKPSSPASMRWKMIGLIALPVIAYLGYLCIPEQIGPCIKGPKRWHEACLFRPFEEKYAKLCDPGEGKKFAHIAAPLRKGYFTEIYDDKGMYQGSWGSKDGRIGLKETEDWKSICRSGSESNPDRCCETSSWDRIIYEKNENGQWSTSVFSDWDQDENGQWRASIFSETNQPMCKWDTIVNGDLPLFNYAPPPPEDEGYYIC